MTLEVIAISVNDAIVAAKNGADRIELVTSLAEGGLTPSYGLIKEVVRSVDIPVNVMIRPHSNSFCYSEEDLLVMMADIKIARELGATGIVLGKLKQDQTIDTMALEKFLSLAVDMDVTFHRAFDEVANQEAALQTLLKYPQVNRILTSGGKSSVIQAVNQIKNLVDLTQDKPLRILAGSGLTLENVKGFISQTGVEEVHFGSGVRIDGTAVNAVDPEKIRSVAGIIGR